MMSYCQNCGKPLTHYDEGVVLGFIPLKLVCNFCFEHYWFKKSEEWLPDEEERRLIEFMQEEDD